MFLNAMDAEFGFQPECLIIGVNLTAVYLVDMKLIFILRKYLFGYRYLQKQWFILLIWKSAAFNLPSLTELKEDLNLSFTESYLLYVQFICLPTNLFLKLDNKIKK